MLEAPLSVRKYPALTLHDVWALYLCASRGLRLLTRSPQLTSAAADAGVVTHSTLWLLDQLVVAGCLSPWEAVAAVRHMPVSYTHLTLPTIYSV